MPLNALTLDDLRKLNDTVTSLVIAGFRLEQGGLAPIFDLTPGQPMRITLQAKMPATRAAAPCPYPESYDRGECCGGYCTMPGVDDETEVSVVDLPSFLKPRSTEAAPPAVGAEPVDPLPALGEVAGGGPVSAEPSRSAEAVAETPRAEAKVEAKAESGGGEELAAPEAPAAPAPGSASAMAATWQAPMWTPEEDARLIDLVVKGMTEHGLSRNRAMMEAARELGRAAEGVKFRCYNKLKARIDAALTEAARRQAQTETPAAEARPVPEAEGDAAAVESTTAAVQDDDALTAHLRGMTDKGGWSLRRDLDLMDFSCQGWPAADIAREINMPDAAIKPRFDALTGLHDDEATGKKARRWTREEVLGALLVMAGKAEAA